MILLNHMPIKHAAFYAVRKAKKNALRNSRVLASLKRLEKKVRATNGGEAGKETISATTQAFDKAVHAGTIHINKARRKKSRLMKALLTKVLVEAK